MQAFRSTGRGPTGGCRAEIRPVTMAALLVLVALFVPVAASAQDRPEEEAAGFVRLRVEGATGFESLELEINGEIVATWRDLATELTVIEAELDDVVTIDRLRVHFTNDRRGVGGDRDVRVDWVEVGDVRLESEDPANRSTGAYTLGRGCSEGYKRTEVLHCTGWIEYAGAVGLSAGGGSGPMPVIFDTDMGPDIDDALALAMLHGYQREGLIDLRAVTISRNSVWGARYADLLNTFYGRPDIPIGTYRGITGADGRDHNWSRPVVQSGRYDHDVHLETARTDGIGVGALVMREVLAEAEDGSVTIIQTGFSGNLAELLTTGPDELSPLTGVELVEAKVVTVSIMGGDNEYDRAEFNIANDIGSAQTVFEQTPTAIVQSEFRLGYDLLYPLSSIRGDFDHAPDHPVPVSYLWSDLSWHDDEADRYNMRAWDLTSVMAAIEPGRWFEVSEPGFVTVDDDGRTAFRPAVDGNVTTIGLHPDRAEADRAAIVDRMIELVAAPID